MVSETGWISIGALLVSLFALLESAKANRKANAIQKKQIEIEERKVEESREAEKRAAFMVDLREKRNAHGLYLSNYGQAEARNVRVKLDGKPLSEHRAAVSNDPMPTFVGAGSDIGCTLAISSGCAPPYEVEIIWDDDSGNDREYCTTLTF